MSPAFQTRSRAAYVPAAGAGCVWPLIASDVWALHRGIRSFSVNGPLFWGVTAMRIVSPAG